jgi:uncharacterized protein
MILRQTTPALLQLAEGYPVLALTGPRQSGKTTLARACFADHPYVSLENPAEREYALDDPAGFLGRHPEGMIIDEVQRCPELFSWLQGIVDERGRPGQFILTGSLQFGLMTSITQSLAGRVAMITLLPFTAAELKTGDWLPGTLDEMLFTGSYPPIYDRRLDPGIWYANYVQTYIERDVRQLINVRDLNQFQRFLRLCAGRTGQLLNLSALGEEVGVTHNTAREWISVLEASFIIHRLPPFHRNFKKRLIKTPKLYFYDSGLASWLLGIENAGQLSTHPLRGALFETWAVAELLKMRLNTARPSNLSFWRDRAGHEVDLLVEQGDRVLAVEIKSGATVTRDSLRGLEKWRDIAGAAAGPSLLVYGGLEAQSRQNIELLPWNGIESRWLYS